MKIFSSKTVRDLRQQIEDLHERIDMLRRERDRSLEDQILRGAELDYREADIAAREIALRNGVVRGFAYATDDMIKALCAGLSDSEKDQEIARLTKMLAREHARVDELSAANDAVIARLKALKPKRTNPETPPPFIDGWDREQADGRAIAALSRTGS